MRPGTLRAYTLGVITGSIVTAGLTVMAAPMAKADSIYDSVICNELDADPTVSTVVILGLALGDQGYTGYESGRIIGSAVIEDCQHHIGLMQKFANIYAPAANVKVI